MLGLPWCSIILEYSYDVFFTNSYCRPPPPSIPPHSQIETLTANAEGTQK